MAPGDSTLRLVLGGSSASTAPTDSDPAPGTALDDDAPQRLIPAPLPEQLPEPGFADIEAAVALVSAGLAARVVLSSFPSWPGLLWRAYELAEEANVLILPTVVRPGGHVDVVITREKPE